MKIVALSDSHMGHKNIKLPKGDILIHAGDATFMGSPDELIGFNNWFGEQDFKYKIFVAGNHDRLFQVNQVHAKDILTSAFYLQDQSIELAGIHFYGSPWQPAFNNWAFNVWTDEELEKIWSKIPEGVDVLITHCPPYGVLDGLLGCRMLYKRILQVKPKIHIFGHIHRGHGHLTHQGMRLYNVSVMDDSYAISSPATVIEI